MRPAILVAVFLVVFIWNVVLNHAAAETVGVNLISNPSLEKMTGNKPAEIDYTFQEGKPSIEVDTSVAHTGNQSVKITCTNADRGAIGKRIKLQGGKTYRFSAWYKTSPGVQPADVTLRLMFSKSASGSSEADKVPLSQEMLVDPSEGTFRLGANNHIDGRADATQNWQQLRMTVQVPTSVMSVTLQVFNWKANGAVWVDDLAVEPVTLTPEDLAAAQVRVQAALVAAAEAKAAARNASVVAQALPQLAAHPRLLANNADFHRMRQYIAGDPTAAKWAGAIQAQANAILSQPVSQYVIPDGKRLLDTSRRVLDRVQNLVLTFRFTDDQRYLTRAWQELAAAARFPNWNPTHFLDTAEMTAAFALAYDWAYDFWTPDQKATLRKAIVTIGLEPGMRFYEGKPSGTNFVNAVHNWNIVCNGGLALGALAVIDTDRDIALDVLNAGLNSLPKALAHFAPDGGWAEGVGYWHYSIRYLIPLIAALQTALGTDFHLGQTTGLTQTGLFPIYMTTPARGVFNFADSGSGMVRPPELLWMAQAFDQPVYAWWLNQWISGSNTLAPLSLLWYRPGLIPTAPSTLPLDGYFRSVEAVSMRSSWTDPKALYLAYKAGDNTVNHGHLDLGSFILEASGVRWALDLGADDYNLPGYFSGSARWNFYRTRAESHNTLVINPGNSPDQNSSAKAAISYLSSTRNAALSVTDLTPAYSTSGATKVERGVALLADRTYALVQDEIALQKPGEIWWFMHTKAAMEKSADERSITLIENGQRLLVRLLEPANAKFAVMAAEPLPSSPTVAGQNKNAGIKMLAIHLKNVGQTRIAVQFVPMNNADAVTRAAASAGVVPLADWHAVYTPALE